MTQTDQQLLTLWRQAEFKGDLMCRLPLAHAARLVTLVMLHEPPLPPCGQGSTRRRAFAHADVSESELVQERA